MGDQQPLGLGAGHGLAVDALDREPLDPAVAHERGQGSDRGLEQLGIDDDQSAPASLDVQRQAPRHEHHPGADRTGQLAGGGRPGDGRAVGIGGVDGGEDGGGAAGGVGSRTSRSRSTAAGRANWAPPSPSTK